MVMTVPSSASPAKIPWLRVRVDLRPEGDIGGGRGLPSDGPGGDRRIGAEGHLAAVDALDPPGGREHQDDVGELYAPLPAEAAASHGDEHRVREATLLVTHDQRAVTAATAEEESRLGQVGKYRDPIGSLEQPIGNPPVAGGGQVLEHLAGEEQATLLACLGMGGGGGGGECESSEKRNDRSAHVHGETSPPFVSCRCSPT